MAKLHQQKVIANNMIKTTFSEHLDALQSEILMILRFKLTYNRLFQSNNFPNGTRAELWDKVISMKAIENDLVMRICKFDDNRRDVHSLKNLIGEIHNNHPFKAKIQEEISQFTTSLAKLKKKRRHEQLAHLKIGNISKEYVPTYYLTHLIRQLVEILDLSNEKKVEYLWSDGKHEKYDLRVEVISKDIKI